MFKRRAVIVLMCFLFISFCAVYYQHSQEKKNSTLKNIMSIVKANGRAGDLLNTLGVQSMDDVFYSQSDKDIRVNFGNFSFTLDKSAIDQSYITDLNTIGITVFVRDDNTLLLKYKGEEVKEVVR